MKKILLFLLSVSLLISGIMVINSASDELPVTNWAVTASSFNAPNGVGREVPELVLDNDTVSHWHSSISPKATSPHFITVELLAITEVGGYRYYPRENGTAGICTEYAIYLSVDDENYQKVAEGKWEKSHDPKTVNFDKNYKTKFVRLELLSASDGYGSAGEIRVLAPVKGRQSANVTGTVKKADLTPVFDPNISEAERRILSKDEILVEGWTFDASSINANNGVPHEVPEKTIDGNFESHWHTTINPKATEPHYITIILPEEEVISGYRYYPRSNAGAGTCTQYEIHISHDGDNFSKIAEGEWQRNASAKSVLFNMNVKVKAVKLVIIKGSDGYGSAGEIRLIQEDPEKKTITAKEFFENNDEYTYVKVPVSKINVKSDKPYSQPLLYMVDDIISTHYHSEITSSPGRLPVTLDFDLGYPYKISGLGYQPRTEGTAGHFKSFEIEYSLDGEKYEFLDSFTFDKVNNDKKEILFDEPLRARFFRIIVLDGHGEYATCGEMEFLQTKKDRKEDDKNDDIAYLLKIGSPEIKVNKFGEEYSVETDVAPFIYRGSTMIPLRGLLEQMGSEVNWVSYDQKIEVFTEREDFMEFQIEEYNVYINDIRYNTPVAPMIKDGRTFIPLRFVSENMGYNVSWNGETQEITITNK